jgi:hypothetical protein
VHGIGVYSAGVGPKGPAMERFLDIKKKKKFCTTISGSKLIKLDHLNFDVLCD